MTKTELSEIREEPGWFGGFTRNQANGAIRNGTHIRKCKTEPSDAHGIGEPGIVLGSIQIPGDPRIGYFVEWSRCPNVAVFVIDWKIEAASSSKKKFY